jgi:DNA-binding transcriptional MerR regulator
LALFLAVSARLLLNPAVFRYEERGLPVLNRILALKDLGLSLEQIAQLLYEDLTPATFERLMERIVGEIGSESDAPSTRVSVLTDGSALLDGLTLVADVNGQFGLNIDEDAYNTIGGFVLGKLGRRPRLGDTVETEGRRIRVEALDGLRVARVLLTPPKAPPAGSAVTGSHA